MMNSNLEQIQERQRCPRPHRFFSNGRVPDGAMFTVTAFAANTETAQGFSKSRRPARPF